MLFRLITSSDRYDGKAALYLDHGSLNDFLRVVHGKDVLCTLFMLQSTKYTIHLRAGVGSTSVTLPLGFVDLEG